MRLILIRHGDPDYSIDSLTEKGWREAALLAKRAKDWQIDDAFVSPLGRARDTARACLKAWGKEEQILDWAQEFYLRSAPAHPRCRCRSWRISGARPGPPGLSHPRFLP